jgi:Protein of unknown function (DUF3224)
MNRFLLLAGLILAGLIPQAGGGIPTGGKEATMTVRGTFDVKLSPQADDRAAAGPFGRLLLNKQFQGELQASSHGQMLSTETGQGSGGYVALEYVTGTLSGLRGSFVLQHVGTMRKGAYVLNVTVVPDSGTEQLKGIVGSMTIVNEGSKHYYTFEYTIEGSER